MTHYYCLGSCHGEHGAPGVCEEKFCTKEGKSLTECECEDGLHLNSESTHGEGDSDDSMEDSGNGEWEE